MDSDKTIPLEDVDEVWLRAWVDIGIISAQLYETEMRRRAEAAREKLVAGRTRGRRRD